MGRRPLIIAVISTFLNYLNYTESASNISNGSNVMTNCTFDDLKHKNISISFALSYKFLHCNLIVIPDAFLTNESSSSSLQSLEFFSSKIISIQSSAFSNLMKLEVLRIVNNPNLTQLNSWSTHNLDNLIELDLHENSFKKMDDNALRHYPNLKLLNLQQNIINDIPFDFFGFSFNLETLNLAENFIQRIDSDMFKVLLRLVDLNLAFNRIDYIDDYAFTTTTRLKVLRLNGNQIRTVNPMIFFNLGRLQFLNLSENALNANAIDEDAFKQNTHLQHLDISHNSIYSIAPNALRGLNSVQILNLSNNHLTSIALKDLDHLKNLDMSYNKLTHLLDNQFSFMGSIETINISHNRLYSIQPFTFTDLVSLNELDLSSNRLHTNDFLDSTPPINIIDLRNNAYEQIDLSALSSIGRILFQNNPWNCSWLLNVIANLEHVGTDIRFGSEYSDGIQYKNHTKSTIKELECVDYRKPLDRPSLRRVFIVNFNRCSNEKNLENNQKKKPAIFTYPRTFNKLLNDEFDYKACLLWTVVAVCLVIGLVRLGKYCLNESEKKSERYRMVQQEKALKDIDEFFAKNNRRKHRS